MEAEEVVQMINQALPDAEVAVSDLRGDGSHFEVRVSSAAFAGLSRLDQHRMVFDAMGGRVGATIQTFALTTLVPVQRVEG